MNKPTTAELVRDLRVCAKWIGNKADRLEAAEQEYQDKASDLMNAHLTNRELKAKLEAANKSADSSYEAWQVEIDRRVKTEQTIKAIGGLPEKWQPIETAPKDGTICLLDANVPWRIRIGFYGNGSWHSVPQGSMKRCQPVYWMPLPKPPKAIIKGGG